MMLRRKGDGPANGEIERTEWYEAKEEEVEQQREEVKTWWNEDKKRCEG